MVNKKDKIDEEDDIIITDEIPETVVNEPEIIEVEADEKDRLKTLRTKLKATEEETRNLREDLQRSKADFLNARKRLEDERLLDKKRSLINHVEKLLPIADSFYIAMIDKETWSKADSKWRLGIEGIFSQLTSLLNSYGVTSYNPTGEIYDHYRHEALSMIKVEDANQNNRVLSVIQLGYEIKNHESTVIIRPARVTVGELQS